MRNVDDEVLYELLIAWEQWTGKPRTFYRELGVDHRKMASLLGRAKKLKREGQFPEEEFREIKIDSPLGSSNIQECQGAELVWKTGQIIRFKEVDMLLDFLKKTA